MSVVVEQLVMTAAELRRARGRFTRIRLLSEPGNPYLDVSSITGALPDGSPVKVEVTFPVGDLLRISYRWQLEWALREYCGFTDRDVAKMGLTENATYSIR